jgi:hypothetical protein
MLPALERWSWENGETTEISTALQWQGKGEKVVDFPTSLESHTYDLPSQFTHPQELARNTINSIVVV